MAFRHVRKYRYKIPVVRADIWCCGASVKRWFCSLSCGTLCTPVPLKGTFFPSRRYRLVGVRRGVGNINIRLGNDRRDYQPTAIFRFLIVSDAEEQESNAFVFAFLLFLGAILIYFQWERRILFLDVFDNGPNFCMMST